MLKIHLKYPDSLKVKLVVNRKTTVLLRVHYVTTMFDTFFRGRRRWLTDLPPTPKIKELLHPPTKKKFIARVATHGWRKFLLKVIFIYLEAHEAGCDILEKGNLTN
jgi:hypothetical protein